MRSSRSWRCATLANCLGCLLITGCPPRDGVDPVADVVPRQIAVDRVNHNAALVNRPLNARGRVRGHVTDGDGRVRSFSLAAHLFYMRPQSLSLDLKDDLAGSQFLLGSNDTYYWMLSKPQDNSYWCRRHDRVVDGEDPEVPINPLQLIEAMGLTPVSLAEENPYDAPAQRIVDDYQQLIFVELDPLRQTTIRREYWNSRRPPFLVSQVIFRDAWGQVQFESKLSDYAQLEDDGPMLPGRIEVSWPQSGAAMNFDISRWRVVPSVRPDGLQFTPPHRRGVAVDQAYIDEP